MISENLEDCKNGKHCFCLKSTGYQDLTWLGRLFVGSEEMWEVSYAPTIEAKCCRCEAIKEKSEEKNETVVD